MFILFYLFFSWIGLCLWFVCTFSVYVWVWWAVCFGVFVLHFEFFGGFGFCGVLSLNFVITFLRVWFVIGFDVWCLLLGDWFVICFDLVGFAFCFYLGFLCLVDLPLGVYFAFEFVIVFLRRIIVVVSWFAVWVFRVGLQVCFVVCGVILGFVSLRCFVFVLLFYNLILIDFDILRTFLCWLWWYCVLVVKLLIVLAILLSDLLGGLGGNLRFLCFGNYL